MSAAAWNRLAWLFMGLWGGCALLSHRTEKAERELRAVASSNGHAATPAHDPDHEEALT